MKAIIPAAGFGTRMRPLTDSTPKALLEVAGQRLIERIVRSLLDRGISEVCVVTGHGRDQLESFLLSAFPEASFTFVFNDAYARTNNIYSMHLAFEVFPLDDDILLIESDLVFENAVLDRILTDRRPNVALVDRFQLGMDGTVVTIENGLITNIIPPHLQGADFDFSDKYKTLNIYKFSREFAQTTFRKLLSFYATVYNNNCYYELVLGMLVYMRHAQIFACEVNGARWCEVDDPNDLRIADVMFGGRDRLADLDASFGGFWNTPVIDFAFIRNMYFPTSSILADLRYNLHRLTENYGSNQAILNRKLAHFLLVSEDRVCLLNGLSQIYPLLGSLLDGKTVLAPRPTFGEYARALPARRTYAAAGLSRVADIPAGELASADVVVLVNPNNPTGSCLPSMDILDFARAAPDKLVLVDESFADFSEQPSVQDLLEREERSNVWVLKSLSKSLGVPGLRIGYMYSRNLDAIRTLNARLPVWNSNALAEYFLELVLKHRQPLAESFRMTIADRAALHAELSRLPIVNRVYPSSANFLLMRLNLTRPGLHVLRKALLDRWNILVKDSSAAFDDNGAYLRIAIRRPDENQLLVQALQEEGAAIAASGAHVLPERRYVTPAATPA